MNKTCKNCEHCKEVKCELIGFVVRPDDICVLLTMQATSISELIDSHRKEYYKYCSLAQKTDDKIMSLLEYEKLAKDRPIFPYEREPNHFTLEEKVWYCDTKISKWMPARIVGTCADGTLMISKNGGDIININPKSVDLLKESEFDYFAKNSVAYEVWYADYHNHLKLLKIATGE